MSPDAPATKPPPVGVLLIASFWFLLGSFALVFIMGFFQYYPLFMTIGLLVSIGMILEGWGLIRARFWAMLIAFVFSVLFSIGSFILLVGVLPRLFSEGFSDSIFLYDFLGISLPFVFLAMTFYLGMNFTRWVREQSLS